MSSTPAPSTSTGQLNTWAFQEIPAVFWKNGAARAASPKATA